MKSLKPVIFCASLIGAAVALVRPLGAQYVERFRAVVTDTNDVVISHANLTVTGGVSAARFSGDGVGGDVSQLPNVAGNTGLYDDELIAWDADPGTPDAGLYSVPWSEIAERSGLGTAALLNADTNEVPDAFSVDPDEYPLVRVNSRDAFNSFLQSHILGWSVDAFGEYGATAYTADETRGFMGLNTTNDVTFARVNAAGVTSTAANTNTAATVWRSSGNETKASIDNETGALVVRGEDSDLRYFAGGFRTQNANLNASAGSTVQYAFLSPSASNLREVTIRWAMDTNSVHDGIVARIGPARSAGGISPYIEIQLQTNSVLMTSGATRYYSQTFSTNYNGSATSTITAPGAWGFAFYNGSAGVATNLGAIVQIECANE